jgi:cell division septum initiation protein DivIVA
MAKTLYADHVKGFRRDGVTDRATYLMNAKQTAMRGSQLPQTKLSQEDVRRIRAMQIKRERLRAMINDRYSNAMLADIFGVHVRTIEKVLRYETHIQVV